jgi:muramoyltetrapeptide carboxypeptidase
MIRPLRQGDRIALIAPSSPFSVERFHEACAVVEAEGYGVVSGKHVFRKKGYLAGTEAERAQDLIDAVSDPEIAAIFCVRGGYGSGKLLPWLPFSVLRDRQKIFVGYSDVTFLHLAFLKRMQWVTFHGPNFVVDKAGAPEILREALASLRGEVQFSWDLRDAHILQPGVASGRVIGGNLTCMVHLLGTPYFPDTEGALLLIEDRGEALYRLDRHLNHLKLAGVLSRLRGMILGSFDGCGDVSAVWDMVAGYVRPYRYLVAAGLPFGHGPVNQVIPLGVPFTLNTYEGSFKALQHPFSK